MAEKRQDFTPISLEDWVAREAKGLPPLTEEQDRALRQILGLAPPEHDKRTEPMTKEEWLEYWTARLPERDEEWVEGIREIIGE